MRYLQIPITKTKQEVRDLCEEALERNIEHFKQSGGGFTEECRILINVSRGSIIANQQLILRQLLSNDLEGYAADVWDNEPPLENDNFYLAWKNNINELKGRVIINPHTAYYSMESYAEMRTKATNNALRIINGKTPFNIIKPNS